MKKMIAAAAALVLVCGAVFAGDFYNGDIQLKLGVGIDSVKLSSKTLNKLTNEDKDYDFTKSTVVDFGLESWHLFKPIDLLGVGFMLDFDIGTCGGSFGPNFSSKADVVTAALGFYDVHGKNTFNFNFAIGPAVGLYLASIVRIGATFGFNAGVNLDTFRAYRTVYEYGYISNEYSSDYFFWSGYAGFVFGLQAKFLPNSVINPIVGWKFVKGFSDTLNQNGHVYTDIDYKFTQNTFYIALSFSW